MGAETLTVGRKVENVSRFIRETEMWQKLRSEDLNSMFFAQRISGFQRHMQDKTHDMGERLGQIGIDLSDPEQLLAVASGGLKIAGTVKRYYDARDISQRKLENILERKIGRMIMDPDVRPEEALGASEAYNFGRPDANPHFPNSTLFHTVTFAAYHEAKLWQQADQAASE